MNVLLTGANGFLGYALASELISNDQISVRTLTRKPIDDDRLVSIVGAFEDVDLANSAVDGVEVVIHCAARAHNMNDSATNPLSEYRKVNVEGTQILAEQAAAAGVKRFIFISSIKVNGESTTHTPFTSQDTPKFEDAYGQSKCEAEESLWEIGQRTGMEVVIIRPPLVYGPGVKGNFASLVKFVNKGMPLPLGAVNNKRSLVALDNLVDLITTCVEHPAAANQTFVVSDDDDVSTTELLRRMAIAFDKNQLLIPVPKWCMSLPARLLGKQGAVDRLFDSLQVDITHTKETLGWKPPVTMAQQLSKMAASLKD